MFLFVSSLRNLVWLSRRFTRDCSLFFLWWLLGVFGFCALIKYLVLIPHQSVKLCTALPFCSGQGGIFGFYTELCSFVEKKWKIRSWWWCAGNYQISLLVPSNRFFPERNCILLKKGFFHFWNLILTTQLQWSVLESNVWIESKENIAGCQKSEIRGYKSKLYGIWSHPGYEAQCWAFKR